MPLFPASGRQRKADLWEFKAFLCYRVSAVISINA